MHPPCLISGTATPNWTRHRSSISCASYAERKFGSGGLRSMIDLGSSLRRAKSAANVKRLRCLGSWTQTVTASVKQIFITDFLQRSRGSERRTEIERDNPRAQAAAPALYCAPAPPRWWLSPATGLVAEPRPWCLPRSHIHARRLRCPLSGNARVISDANIGNRLGVAAHATASMGW